MINDQGGKKGVRSSDQIKHYGVEIIQSVAPPPPPPPPDICVFLADDGMVHSTEPPSLPPTLQDQSELLQQMETEPRRM